MKNSYKLALWVCAIVLFSHGHIQGQELALSKPEANTPQNKSQAAQSLQKILSQLESQYKVNFAYEEALVTDKVIQLPAGRITNLAKTLNELLNPLNLKVEKINNNLFLILSQPEKGKPQSKTNTQVSPHNSVNTTIIAADFSVNGKVTDESGTGLPGVSVLVKGTTLGTTTNSDGTFTLSVPQRNSILIFSFIGFSSQEVPVNGQANLSIQMAPDAKALDEVVVVGYGVVKKSDLTGSLSQVKTQEIRSFPTNNVLQAISGRASGVQVLQTTGAPGAGLNVRIRGTNSIQGGNEPLYVIDGFPFSGNPTNLNNADIESIEVLKDASATAIYGSRGANGVVLITTKQGKAGQTRVEYETTYSMQTLRKKLELMNGQEYAMLNNLQAANDKIALYFTQEQINNFGEGTDWQDVVFQKAPMASSSLSVNGGNEKTQFSVTGSYLGQEGIIKGSDYNRYALSTKINHKISDKFQINFSNNASRLATERKDSEGGSRGNSMIGAAISAAPISTPYREDGSYSILSQDYPFVAVDIRNPLNYINEQFNTIKANVLLTNASLLFNPIPELTVKISGGIENRDDRTDNYTTRKFLNSEGRASVSTSQFTSLLSENTISYLKTLNEDHQISAVAGFTYQDFLTTSLSGSGTGFLSDAFETYNLEAAATPGIANSGYAKSVLLSYLGRLNYSFNNKYLLTVSFRTDGSSRYSDGKKWGSFPSAALAWRASEEEFLKSSNIFSDLKVRASWGLTGSQAISPYTTLNQLSSGNTVFGNSLYTTFAPSTVLPGNLKWETTEQINFGFDLGILENRLYLTTDYYIKNTRDLLNTVRLPNSLSFTTTIRNVGEVQNKGLELGLEAKAIQGKFNWDLFGNISFNRNKVVSLNDGKDILGTSINVLVLSDNLTILREGRPIGQFWGYQEDGYTDKGQIKFKDLNNDGAISADDKTYIGNPNPKFIYGLNSNMSFNNFELTAFFQGSYGNDIFNVSAIPSTLDYGQGLNMPREVFQNHWTPENPNAKYPIISRTTSARASDRWIEDGSYLRLRNIQLAYNLPIEKFSLGWIKNAQVSVSGQNLVTWTKYSWWDPEINSRGAGIDYYSYPISKVVTAGIRIGF
ncbi:SusC/RagA family TonB-linked outer membrane protein [Adhaeribacter aerolatus]|uniref:SusC/RagA family TonB-linked outer membrane protein n=1 Tax=Adhaeribacter aerolatus TaxID=670289 RepID=A0A512AXA4_9BACT|nr:TonB-dependent receptor [Adhaeribacter aerolatus]GEO04355.1 SusC/RagA family TonB-linked outer membrane protein [Adhaeribacter aerolatus]